MGNSIRTAFLLALMFAIVFGLAFGGAFGFELWYSRIDDTIDPMQAALRDLHVIAPYLAVGSVTWIALAILGQQIMIGGATGMRVVTPGRLPNLQRMLERLSARAGIATPKLAIIETPEMNAFASGISKDDYTVTFTTGLLERLSPEEIEGVMAHELAHIKHRDVRLMVIAATVTGGIALIFEWIYFLVWHGAGIAISSVASDAADWEIDGGEVFSGWLAMLVCLPILIIAWLIMQLTGLAISRTREYMADAGAAEMTGNPQALISALRKISDDCDIDAPTGIMRMCIQVPEPVINLLSTHPSVEDRIAALSSMRALNAAYMARERHATATPVLSSVKHAPAGLKPRASFGRR